MKHDELAHALALDLSAPHKNPGFITWENIEFPCSMQETSKGLIPAWACRPDVFAVQATHITSKWKPVTYEVKVSRADLLADLRSEKWRRYLRFSAYVRIAMPGWLVNPSELPDELGLIAFGGRAWKTVKRGRLNKGWELTPRDWHNLCLRARNPTPWERRMTPAAVTDTPEDQTP